MQSVVSIRTLERVRAFKNGVIAGLVIGLVILVIKVIFFVFSERDKAVKEYVEKQDQCYTYQNAIEELEGELLSGRPDVVKKFNTLVDKFNQLHCPEIIFNNYSTGGKE